MKKRKSKKDNKFLNELVAKVSTKIKQWKELHLLERNYTLLPEEEPLQLIIAFYKFGKKSKINNV